MPPLLPHFVEMPMSLSFFIARRYLFSKQSHNAINIISAIAMGGVAVATIAMICVLSVFNGFRDLIATLYTTFDPQLVVVPAKGKFAAADDAVLMKIRGHKEVAAASETFEENALILFRGHPLVVKIKGVDERYAEVTDIRTILRADSGKQPRLLFNAAEVNYGILGQGLKQQIGTADFGELQICAPRAGERINIANPIESFSVANLHANGTYFTVEQRKYDDHYILTSLSFATSLFEKEGLISRLELKLRPNADVDAVKEELRRLAGDRFKVLDRMEQQADVFNVMQVEKLIAYIFLTFILLIACFNIISSLSMLILEKRGDVETLRHLGLSPQRVRNIFLTEGSLFSLFGALVGIGLGVGLCLLQQHFGLFQMGNGSEFIVRYYPVVVQWNDVALVFATVVVVGFVSVWYPVHAMSRRLLG